MAQFEVVQRLAAFATTYDVRADGKDEVTMIARGEATSLTPKFVLADASDKVLATLEGNLNKTAFHVLDPEKKELASITFPSIALKKTLALTVDGRTYTADAGVLALEYDFKCQDEKGAVAVEVKKREGLTKVRDRFSVESADDVPPAVAVLVTVAIHSRYFEMV